MKEFRQYDKKYCDRETSHCCLNLDIYCEHCEELRKQGWRAALEMVLKKENVVRFCWRAEYKSEEAIPTIYDDIREELEK